MAWAESADPDGVSIFEAIDPPRIAREEGRRSRFGGLRVLTWSRRNGPVTLWADDSGCQVHVQAAIKITVDMCQLPPPVILPAPRETTANTTQYSSRFPDIGVRCQNDSQRVILARAYSSENDNAEYTEREIACPKLHPGCVPGNICRVGSIFVKAQRPPTPARLGTPNSPSATP